MGKDPVHGRFQPYSLRQRSQELVPGSASPPARGGPQPGGRKGAGARYGFLDQERAEGLRILVDKPSPEHKPYEKVITGRREPAAQTRKLGRAAPQLLSVTAPPGGQGLSAASRSAGSEAERRHGVRRRGAVLSPATQQGEQTLPWGDWQGNEPYLRQTCDDRRPAIGELRPIGAGFPHRGIA